MTDTVLARVGTAQLVIDSLASGGFEQLELYTDIPVDSSLAVVNRIAQYYRDKGCVGIIAVGGGSVIDTAKGVRLLISQGAEDILRLSGLENICCARGSAVPFVVIPTTAGTGSECTGVAVIKNEEAQVKMEFLSPFVLPDVALIDPRMTLSLPPQPTAATGMDALCHAIEAASCLQNNPLSTAYASQAIALITASIEQAASKGSDKVARYQMALGSCMAGIAFSNSMVGLVHAIGHALGGLCRVPHAQAMGILLPHVMRYNSEVCAASYAAMKPFMQHQHKGALSLEAVEELLLRLHEQCGLPTRLREVGVEPSCFEQVAQHALNDGALIVNPRGAGVLDMIDLLQAAY